MPTQQVYKVSEWRAKDIKQSILYLCLSLSLSVNVKQYREAVGWGEKECILIRFLCLSTLGIL